MQKAMMLNFVFCLLLLPVSNVVGQDEKSPSLKKLHRAIDEIVVRHYPRATSHVFEQTIGFEFATRVYVTRLVSKRLPGMAPLLGCERGPMDNGVWCDIWYRTGDLKTEPAYARAEGVTNREFFREHIYYPNDRPKKCHLMVVLRLPLESDEAQTKFVEELRGLLNEFGKYLPAKVTSH